MEMVGVCSPFSILRSLKRIKKSQYGSKQPFMLQIYVSHICPKCKSDKLIKSGKNVTDKQHIVVKNAANDL